MQKWLLCLTKSDATRKCKSYCLTSMDVIAQKKSRVYNVVYCVRNDWREKKKERKQKQSEVER